MTEPRASAVAVYASYEDASVKASEVRSAMEGDTCGANMTDSEMMASTAHAEVTTVAATAASLGRIDRTRESK
jgi:hypothetical protein